MGVPEIVIVLLLQFAVTPAGNPVAVPMPVALVVECVILVRGVLIQREGEEEAAPAVLSALTVIVPVALILPQPVRGML